MNIKRNEHTTHSFFQSALKWSSIFLLAFSMMSLPSVSAANESEAGKVIFIFGQAWKHSVDGGKHDLKRGMKVHVGETIETSSNGQVQIRMNDNGLIAIRPGSQFKIQAYKYSQLKGADSSGDKSHFQLLKGGFRSITGAVGQRDKKAYKVTTPVATIGIRGTDYSARLCSGDCQQADGLYTGVWQGGVSVSNESGTADIDAGQYAYVASANTSPVTVPSLPADLLVSSTGSAATEDMAASETEASASESLAILDSIQQNLIATVVSLPKTGTATYSNVIAVSGSNLTTGATVEAISSTASLTADFTNQSVDANVNMNLSDGANWNGISTGMKLNFDGSFSGGTMTDGGSTNAAFEVSTSGGGSMSGNMTGMGDGTTPTGATLDVKMQSTFPSSGTEQLEASFILQ